MKRSIRVGIIAFTLLIGIQLVQSTYMYFRAKVVNEDVVSVGTLQIQIVPRGDGVAAEKSGTLLQYNGKKEMMPGDGWPNEFYVTNEGNRPAYIRIYLRLSEREKISEVEEVKEYHPSSEGGVEFARSNQDWLVQTSKEGEEILYYRYPVQPGESTTNFVDSVNMNMMLDNQYANKTYTLSYIAQAVQKNIGDKAILSAWNQKANISKTGEILSLEEQ